MSNLNEHMIRKIWNVYTDTGEWPEFLDAVNNILVEYEDDKDIEIKCMKDMIEQRDTARIGRVDIIARLTKEKRELQDFIKTEADWLEEQGFGTDAERFRAKGGES